MQPMDARDGLIRSHAAKDGPIIVGIGASAGGVEALEQLFRLLPTDLKMAYVVVQHLSPNLVSLMPDIIACRTTMPVVEVSDNMPLEAGKVYVLPGGLDVMVTANTLNVQEQVETRGWNRPIDTFFRSLANEARSRAIGIVLSGGGDDGCHGVRDIQRAGGTVIVQSKADAKFDSMPNAAIASGAADTVIPVSEIPDVLQQYDEIRSHGDQVHDEEDLNISETEGKILNLLEEKYCVDFRDYKVGMVSRRMERRVTLTNSRSLEEYYQNVSSDTDELERLFADLLIGVTRFFRDPDAFESLQQKLLPALLDEAEKTGTLRVWVTSCSTGEEAYSIAILIDEMIRSQNRNITLNLFATDLNHRFIKVASEGFYPEEAVSNVDQERRKRYFNKVGNGYQISRDLKKKIVFACHNVIHDAPFTKMHLVCCRNFLIYLKPAAKRKVLSLLNFSLRDSGVLFLGSSESLADITRDYVAVDPTCRLFRKIRTGPLIANSLSSASTSGTTYQTLTGPLRPTDLLNIYDSLLGEYMPPGLLIDCNNQISHIFGAATRFLKFPEGRTPGDFTKLLPEVFQIAVASGLKRSRKDGKPCRFTGLSCETDLESGTYSIDIKPVNSPAGHLHLVTFEATQIPEIEVAPDTKSASLGDTSPDSTSQNIGDETDLAVISQLKQELLDTRDSLHMSIQDLKGANEEMQTSNEELLASNEELQSTNEELHSVNEELYTVNGEHQRKISELTELTDDMENLLDSIRVDTIFLDHDLKVRKFTLGIARTFRLIPQDVGRNIDSFNHELVHDDVVGLVKRVLATERAHEEEIRDKSGNWYLMRLLPYSSRGRVDGVLLTLIEISSIKETERRLEELSELVENSDDAIFRITADGVIRTWNHGAETLLTLPADEVLGRNIDVLAIDSHGKESMSEALEKILRREPVERIDLKAVRRGGEELDVQMTVSPIHNADGELDAASIVLRDVTSQKQAEAENINALKRRDQFLAMLSHELRNPISAIMNALAVLKKREERGENDQQARDIIFRHAMQLAKLLDDLLEVSRITHDKIQLNIEPVDVCSLAREVVECVQEQVKTKELNLTVDVAEQPLYINADPVRIVQAQTNLLVNATRYTPFSGNITYAIFERDGHAVMEVRDDGEGMTEDFQKKIFEVFVQAEQTLDRTQGGMGLGLPIVKMIVQAHDGEISAHSNGEGRGSIFSISIPLTELRPHTTMAKSMVNEMADGRVLLVEDNDGAREMLEEFLRHEGFDVKSVANGLDAVSEFLRLTPTVCIVDIGLPDLDGFEVARRIRAAEHSPEALIALTGYGQESDRAEVIEAGFDMHIVKPVDPNDLSSIIANHLTRASVRAPHGKMVAPARARV